MNEKLVWAMKFCYLVPIAVYVFTLISLEGLSPLDYGALGLTFLGTVIVVKAKVVLGKHHAWTGYCKDETKLVIRGIYKWIRHPMYLGIFVFTFGASLTMISNIPWFLVAPTIASISYIIVFLTLSSRKETSFLEGKFGSQFIEYRKQVHPFLPIQKHSIDKNPD
ncbi:isoprenylcysteine carboxylmethyltransferase family protein [Candidatus Bipolaricaulota bacterium]|nr:isoprenylcysteine carboxylmethyltransferase family protein [Candidatus Bipolaricaulota bacterium]